MLRRTLHLKWYKMLDTHLNLKPKCTVWCWKKLKSAIPTAMPEPKPSDTIQSKDRRVCPSHAEEWQWENMTSHRQTVVWSIAFRQRTGIPRLANSQKSEHMCTLHKNKIPRRLLVSEKVHQAWPRSWNIFFKEQWFVTESFSADSDVIQFSTEWYSYNTVLHVRDCEIVIILKSATLMALPSLLNNVNTETLTVWKESNETGW